MKLITSYYKPKPGGFCKRYFRGINALLARGHEVHYMALEAFPIDHKNCIYHPFVLPVKDSEGLFFWAIWHLFAPLQLCYLTIKYNIDRSFCFNPGYGFILQFSKLVSRDRILSVFLRSDAIETHRINQKRPFIIAIDTLVEGLGIFNNNLYSVSQSCLTSVLQRHQFLKPKSTRIFRNNIDTNIVMRTYKKDNNSIHVACIGMIESVKNQHFLIKIWPEVNQSRHLHIYGDGPEKRKLANYARELGLEDRIIFHGWMDMKTIWPDIDLLLVPSKIEGSPNVVLEALSLNLPVYASDIGSLKEILPANYVLQLNSDLWVGQLNKFTRFDKIKLAEDQDYQKNRQKFDFDWDEKFCNYVTGSAK